MSLKQENKLKLAERLSAPSCIQKLIAMKDSLKPLKTAVVHPADAYSLQGAVASAQEGLIDPVLVGPRDKIEAIAKQEGIDISPYAIIATEHSHAAAAMAVQLVHERKVEALMKGKLHTDELMQAVVDKDKGLRTGRRMSHVFIMDIPNYHKPLFLTDAALNIQPKLMDKKDIVQNAIDLFCILGFGTPKVAILSAVETVNENIPSTLDATALCKMAERGQITGGILDGPLAFDNAVSKESAAIKGIHSEVAGDADILVVPDIESGNMLYKQTRFLTGSDGAGIVMGARVPIILTSRAGDSEARKGSSALALVYARNRENLSTTA
jgi:phosphate acetyltransferase